MINLLNFFLSLGPFFYWKMPERSSPVSGMLPTMTFFDYNFWIFSEMMYLLQIEDLSHFPVVMEFLWGLIVHR